MRLAVVMVELRSDLGEGPWWYFRLDDGREFQFPVSAGVDDLASRLAALLRSIQARELGTTPGELAS